MSQFHTEANPAQPSPIRADSTLHRLTDRDLPYLQSLLDGSENDDPYQLSASYFALTGRRSLWIARDRHSTVILCRHPNTPNTLLLFPPIGSAGADLLDATIERLLARNTDLTLARAEPGLANALSKRLRSCVLKPIPETVLDWAFPVHVLDTRRVVACRGIPFQNFRTGFNKVDREAVDVVDLAPPLYRSALVDLLREWASNDASLIAPYERLFELFKSLPLKGRLVLSAGQPIGMSIWEMVRGHRRLANAFALLRLRNVPGIARFVILDMCRQMQEENIANVCVGGSETRGLDSFKRQLRPVKSFALHSWRIEPR